MTCPDCQGTGSVLQTSYHALSTFGRPVKCRRCKGSGEITAEQVEWIKRGKAMRDTRVFVTHKSLEFEANRLGLGVRQYLDMEMGRIEPITQKENAC